MPCNCLFVTAVERVHLYICAQSTILASDKAAIVEARDRYAAIMNEVRMPVADLAFLAQLAELLK